ncbi:MAG TPA: 3-oxoacyl-[acyl-carrier-protein] synthase III C-terminal domain-containing protein [Spirochaetota bacterium]|nr:3-oxoacyl-ACP synthase [Spirochaetota bacterium]HOD16271.1 3-oxoacyl-[acyl-carrier-protein] synthase III C-terminal domain-containing protein [Spirochaetota bacterium]HPG51639.1 3-oxoacyl-[acyl-carrier-protein] synthase III C-terminal domain-containing protein [Spirochaetota bacterium]HQL81490.1 3-oxoacyl-[acyl-carrier-protein] synthase III C-terminal domain-containing protein [Spirochaetota bacterium]
MKSRIESLGVYFPEKVLSTEELMSRCRKRPRWDLEKLTGVRERRVVGKDEFALDLAVKAAEKALAMSKYDAGEIGLIISCSISRLCDREKVFCFEPSMASQIKRRIGASGAMTFDVVNACAGMFTGIYIMDSMIRAGVVKTGIVVSGESITHLADQATKEIRSSFDGQLASLTVGDSGAAVIMEGSRGGSVGFHNLDMITVPEHSGLCVAHPSKKGPGAVMITRPVRLQKAAMKIKDPFFKKSIDRAGWTVDRIDAIIPHQTSSRAIRKGGKTLMEYLGTDRQMEGVSIVDRYGNPSTTSHFVALHETLMDGRVFTGSNIIFMIQASGLIMGQCSYTMDDLPDRYRSLNGKGGESICAAG